MKERHQVTDNSRCSPCRSKTFKSLQACTRLIGISIINHSVWFVLLPAVAGIAFVGIILSSEAPPRLHSPAVKKMFTASTENIAEVHHFEEEWFGDTWSQIGCSRHSAQLILRTRYDVDILSEPLINEVLRLHEFVTKVQVEESSRYSERKTVISYKDVCSKTVDDSHRGQHGRRTAFCSMDPLIQIFLCSADIGSLIFKVEQDSKSEDLSNIFFMPPSSYSFNSNLSDVDSCVKLAKKETFLGQSIGLVDAMKNLVVSAQAIRINYIMQDRNEGDWSNTRSWLRELERQVSTFESDLLWLLAVTSESLDDQWIATVNLNVFHGLALCFLNFFVVLVFVAVIENIFVGAYLAVCGSASLAMTLIGTYTFHFIAFGTPTFNFPQCAVFVSVVQIMFQLLYVKTYFFTEDGRRDHEQLNSEESFLVPFQVSVVSNLGYFLLFVIGFPLFAVPRVLPSLSDMSATCCIGYTLAFLYQSTYLPGCLNIYEKRLRGSMERIRGSFWTSKQKHSQLSDVSTNTEEERIVEQSASGRERPRGGAVAKRPEPTKAEKFKKKLTTCVSSYHENVVSDYMRPIAVLVYLAYLSCSYVGCLHFTERISPSQLLTTDSDAFEYYRSAEDYFKPFGPQFFILGTFQGQPWDEDVLKELFKIHRRLLDVEAVDNKISKNWFEAFIKYAVEDDIAQDEDRTEDEEPDLYGGGLGGVGGYGGYDYTQTGEEEEPDFFDGVDDAFWQEKDWLSSWINFTQTDVYTTSYADDIATSNSSGSHQTFHRHEEPDAQFRWVYKTTYSSFPGARGELMSATDEILEQTNQSIVSSLFVDASDFDWWKSIGAHQFITPFVCLIVVGLLVIISALIIIKSPLIVFWSAAVAVSMAFGLCGIISFLGIGLDPIVFPCIAFALPYSVTITFNLLRVFMYGTGEGRASWAKISLRQSASQSLCHILLLLITSLVLSYQPSYLYRAPFLCLVCLAFVAAIHFFLFLPVLLTIFPPSKKATLGLPGKPQANKAGQADSDTEACPVTDSRPHLHARRFFYDTQRAASFRSEDDDSKIEHITCV